MVTGLEGLSDKHTDQEQYDRWHSRLMTRLMLASAPTSDGTGLTLGQAQKWVNMSVKYAVGGRLADFEQFEKCAHVPIDRILLKELAIHPKYRSVVDLLPEGAWSRMDNPHAYGAFQRKLRELASPEPPLLVELDLWMKSQLESNDV